MQAYLPPHSDRPLLLGEVPGPSLTALIQVVRSLQTDLEQSLLSPTAMGRRWREIAEELASWESLYRHDPERRHQGQTIRWQRHVWSDTHEHESPEMLESYRIYDAHFKIMRMDSMTREELAHQCLSTLRRTASDLPETFLTREHHRTLASAFATMLEQIFTKAASELARPAAVEMETIDPIEGRWRNGHHLFGLCCCLGRESLHEAADAIVGDDLAEACRAVDRASLYLAASSAAMVYTTDFPAEHYRSRIRAAMPPGFSGSHNADFNHFKQLKGKLHVVAFQKWGPKTDAWPSPLVASLRHFRDTDLLDLDQHILIAAANIGFGLSLKQAQERQNDASAIEGLRRMAEARKKDFHLHS